jgi:hypothetical protein
MSRRVCVLCDAPIERAEAALFGFMVGFCVAQKSPTNPHEPRLSALTLGMCVHHETTCGPLIAKVIGLLGELDAEALS